MGGKVATGSKVNPWQLMAVSAGRIWRDLGGSNDDHFQGVTMPKNEGGLTTVHVSTQKTWYGGELQAFLLICGLRERGHRVIVFARRGGEFSARARDAGFEVREIERRGRGPKSLWTMRQWLKEIRPDITHAHDSHALTAVGLASIGLKIPLRVAARRVDFPIRSALKFTRLVDVVIAISNPVAQICREGGIPVEMLRVVHSGVDPSRVRTGCRVRGREVLDVSEDEILVLMVANLTHHKGHDTLLRAMPSILDRYPNVRLALAGSGELDEPLHQQMHVLGLDHSIRFLGFRSDIPDLLAAADLFVMPSLQEGLCTSLIDAMFAEIPVIATSAGGIRDLLGLDSSEGPCGHIVEPGDSKSLSDAVLTAIEDPHAVNRLAQRGLVRAKTQFTHTRMIEGTLSVYRETPTLPLRQSA